MTSDRRPEDLCVASRRTRITRDLAQVVVVAVANGAAQGPHDLSGVVVGSLDVHRLAFQTEGDIDIVSRTVVRDKYNDENWVRPDAGGRQARRDRGRSVPRSPDRRLVSLPMVITRSRNVTGSWQNGQGDCG